MANIDPELQAIREAVYGEEVRGSIVNALEAMNEQASKAQEWATGVEDPTDEPSETNNAAYYADQAAASLALAQETVASITDLFNYVADHNTSDDDANNVYYAWDEETKEILTVNGTASGFSTYYLKGGNSKSLMRGFVAGESYVIGVTRLNPDVGTSSNFQIYCYSDDDHYVVFTATEKGTAFTIPSDTQGVQLRVTVASGKTANEEKLTNFSITKARTNSQLDASVEEMNADISDIVDRLDEDEEKLSAVYDDVENLIAVIRHTSASERDITFSWNAEQTILTVDGGPNTGFTSYKLKGSNSTSAPDMCNLVAGESYIASYRRVNPAPTDVVFFRVDSYNENGTLRAVRVNEPDTPFTVPEDAVTIYIRVCVSSGDAPDEEQLADFAIRKARSNKQIDQKIAVMDSGLTQLLQNKSGAEHFALGTFDKQADWYTLTGTKKSGTTYYRTEPIPVEPGRTYYSAWAAETTTFDDGVCVGAWLDKDKRWMAPIQVLSLYREHDGVSKLAYRNNAVIYKDGNYYRANGAVSGAWDSSDWTEIDKPEGFAEIVDYTPNEEVDGWEKWWTGNSATTNGKQYANLYSLTAPENAAYLVLNLRTTGATLYDTSSVQSISTVPAMYPTGMPNQRWDSTDALHWIWQDKKLCCIGQSGFMIDRVIRKLPNENISNVTYKPLPGFQEYLIPYFKEVRSFGYSGKNYFGSDGNIYDYIVTGGVDLSGYDVFMFELGGNNVGVPNYQEVIGNYDSTDLNTMFGGINGIIDYILDQTQGHAEPPSIFILTMPAKSDGGNANTYFNHMGRKLCEYRHLNLIDLAANMGNVIKNYHNIDPDVEEFAFMPERYYYDVQHMNAYGQRMRAHVILDGLLHQNNSIFTPRMDTLETSETGIPSLKLGNTTLTEAQLQALLALLQN